MSPNKNAQGMRWPSFQINLRYIVAAVVLSQFVMLLDKAIILAYIFVPLVLFFQWQRSANITWRGSRRAYLLCFALGLAWALLGGVSLAYFFYG